MNEQHQSSTNYRFLLTGGLIGFAVGVLGDLLAAWIQQEVLNAFTPTRVAIILGLAVLGVLAGAWLERRLREPSAKEREKYDNSMKMQDLGAARTVHEQSALRKLKSSNTSEARIGIQEIAALGAGHPFEKGFNALAAQLARRRSWLLKFEIVEALTVVAKPIREQYKLSDWR